MIPRMLIQDRNREERERERRERREIFHPRLGSRRAAAIFLVVHALDPAKKNFMHKLSFRKKPGNAAVT